MLNPKKTTNATIGKRYPVKSNDFSRGFYNARTGKYVSDPAGFMVSIIKQQRSAYSKEIDHWKAAEMLAENIYMPRRTLLYDLYKDIMKDLFIYGQIQNRINRICNKQFRIVGGKKKVFNEEKTDLFKKAWFYDFIKFAMESKFYGYSLVYTSELAGNIIKSVKIVDREHVVPTTREILYQTSDASGINYETDPEVSRYCIGIGRDDDLGLLNKIAPLYILKKHSWTSWDQFEEMFGIPIRIAKSASQDPKVQAEMEGWLRDMGSAGYGLFPQDAELEIKESNRADAFQVFDMKRKACNEEIALGINGQFETSTSSGSRAKSESVVESTQDEMTQDDLRFIYYVVNDQLIPLMQGLGYPINNETDDFDWDLTVELPPEKKIKIYQTINDMGFELDADDVSNAFGVKILGKKQVIVPHIEPKDVDPENPDPKPDPTKNKDIENLLKMHTGIAKLYSNNV